MASPVPIVDYLVLDGPGVGGVPRMTAHLVANECTACGARFFDRRNACANAARHRVHGRAVATTGEVKAFTIVAFAAPGIPVPFVAGVVDCDGTSVRANLINVEPDPEHVTLGHEGPAGHLRRRHRRRRHRGHRLRLRTPRRLRSMAMS